MTTETIKRKFPRADAMRVAIELSALLNPFCERLEIAGSLRRRKELVGDIELLLIPRFESVADGLFDKRLVDLADAQLNRLLSGGVIEKRLSKTGIASWGPQNKLARHVESGIPVDCFSTDAERWWVALVIRTGSKETNLRLTHGANALGRTLHAYGAGATCRKTGQFYPCRTEAEVFAVCGVPYLPPEQR